MSEHPTPPIKLLLTPKEAATALGIGLSLLYDLLAKDAILSIKIGRARRIPVSALKEYIARLEEEAREGT